MRLDNQYTDDTSRKSTSKTIFYSIKQAIDEGGASIFNDGDKILPTMMYETSAATPSVVAVTLHSDVPKTDVTTNLASTTNINLIKDGSYVYDGVDKTKYTTSAYDYYYNNEEEEAPQFNALPTQLEVVKDLSELPFNI